MATLGHAYAGANVERGTVAQHIGGYHCQPSITPRVPRRPAPVQVPALRRGEPRVHGNPFDADAAVDIHDGPNARVVEVHIAHQDGTLKLAGSGTGRYVVPVSGTVTVAWHGSGVPTWEWTIIPAADPGQNEE